MHAPAWHRFFKLQIYFDMFDIPDKTVTFKMFLCGLPSYPTLTKHDSLSRNLTEEIDV